MLLVALVLRLTVNCIVARTGAHFYRFAIGGRIDAIGGTCSGQLSERIDLTRQQVIDVYAGTNLSEDKRNAYVNDVIIEDSGVANFILVGK